VRCGRALGFGRRLESRGPIFFSAVAEPGLSGLDSQSHSLRWRSGILFSGTLKPLVCDGCTPPRAHVRPSFGPQSRAGIDARRTNDRGCDGSGAGGEKY
jgi:hypothetical protein